MRIQYKHQRDIAERNDRIREVSVKEVTTMTSLLWLHLQF